MKYTAILCQVRLVEVEAENYYDAIEKAQEQCSEKEKVGEVIKESLTTEMKVKIKALFE